MEANLEAKKAIDVHLIVLKKGINNLLCVQIGIFVLYFAEKHNILSIHQRHIILSFMDPLTKYFVSLEIFSMLLSFLWCYIL